MNKNPCITNTFWKKTNKYVCMQATLQSQIIKIVPLEQEQITRTEFINVFCTLLT